MGQDRRSHDSDGGMMKRFLTEVWMHIISLAVCDYWMLGHDFEVGIGCVRCGRIWPAGLSERLK